LLLLLAHKHALCCHPPPVLDRAVPSIPWHSTLLAETCAQTQPTTSQIEAEVAEAWHIMEAATNARARSLAAALNAALARLSTRVEGAVEAQVCVRVCVFAAAFAAGPAVRGALPVLLAL
jgi:hypothetical protein